VRERLTTLIDSASRSTPTAEQVREAGELERDTATVLERYRTFLADEITPLQHELARTGAPLDLAAKPPPDLKPGPDTDERAARKSDDE
jgi:hypothetical protein